MDKKSDPAYCFIFSPVECPAFPMTPIMTQPSSPPPASAASWRSILQAGAVRPPKRRAPRISWHLWPATPPGWHVILTFGDVWEDWDDEYVGLTQSAKSFLGVLILQSPRTKGPWGAQNPPTSCCQHVSLRARPRNLRPNIHSFFRHLLTVQRTSEAPHCIEPMAAKPRQE